MDDLGASVSWRDAAAMVACLPSDSSYRRSLGDGWSESERLLAEVVRSVDVIWWQRTKDGQRNGATPPERLMSPSAREREAERAAECTPQHMAYVADMLGIPEGRR